MSIERYICCIRFLVDIYKVKGLFLHCRLLQEKKFFFPIEKNQICWILVQNEKKLIEEGNSQNQMGRVSYVIRLQISRTSKGGVNIYKCFPLFFQKKMNSSYSTREKKPSRGASLSDAVHGLLQGRAGAPTHLADSALFTVVLLPVAAMGTPGT